MTKTPTAWTSKAKIDKWDLIKLQSFYTVKETVTRMNGSQQNGEKFLQFIHLTKGSYPEFSKNSKRFTRKKTNNLIQKWAKDRNRHFTKEDIHEDKKHAKMLTITVH